MNNSKNNLEVIASNTAVYRKGEKRKILALGSNFCDSGTDYHFPSVILYGKQVNVSIWQSFVLLSCLNQNVCM